MPNMGIQFCPYYLETRSKQIISCEDAYRRFDTEEERNKWMTEYCNAEEGWQDCPYAMDLNDAYQREDGGETYAVEEHTISALQRELKGLATRLGRAEKRLASRENEIKELRKKNKRLEELREQTYRDLRQTQSAQEEMDKAVYRDIQRIAQLYEDRICYLMDTYAGGRLREQDVVEWAEGKEYALTFEPDKEETIWIVKTRSAEDEQKKYAQESASDM